LTREHEFSAVKTASGAISARSTARERVHDVSGKIGTALLSLALGPHTTADRESLRRGLDALMAEDPTITATSGGAGEVVIGGMGELHLEMVVDRLKRAFGVEASVGRPKVAYKETLTRPADGDVKYLRQTPGGRQYAHAKIHLYPGAPGSGYVFENAIADGAIPAKFVRSIDEGIGQALARGVLAGYPVVDVRIALYDGSYHDAESSEAAFALAGSMAFNEAARKAQPVLLEPIMDVEIAVPKEDAGGVIGNLSGRRAQIQSREDRDAVHIISARVPLWSCSGTPPICAPAHGGGGRLRCGSRSIGRAIRLRPGTTETTRWCAFRSGRCRRFVMRAPPCRNQPRTTSRIDPPAARALSVGHTV
jgi:translation elongation factor EF-G